MTQIDTTSTINAIRLVEQGSNPASPAASHWVLFIKSDGLYIKDSAGNVTGPFGAGGGDVATDPIWDAAGDLAIGTGANTASRLAVGTAKQILQVNDGATAPAWVSRWPYSILTPPVLGDFSWVNQGSATGTTQHGGVYMFQAALAGNNVRMLEKAAPATPYTITAAFVPQFIVTDYPKIGIYFRQSSDGKIAVNSFSSSSGTQKFYIDKYTDSTHWSASYANLNSAFYPNIFWLRIADTGVNRVSSLSYDGITFHTIHTVGRTDFLTADKVGMFIEANNAVCDVGALFIHWAAA